MLQDSTALKPATGEYVCVLNVFYHTFLVHTWSGCIMFRLLRALVMSSVLDMCLAIVPCFQCCPLAPQAVTDTTLRSSAIAAVKKARSETNPLFLCSSSSSLVYVMWYAMTRIPSTCRQFCSTSPQVSASLSRLVSLLMHWMCQQNAVSDIAYFAHHLFISTWFRASDANRKQHLGPLFAIKYVLLQMLLCYRIWWSYALQIEK